jgi:hypothetical protein
LLICCFKTAVLLNNNYIIIPCGPQYLFGPRLGCAREYGSVMVDQKIHEKCAIFVIAILCGNIYQTNEIRTDSYLIIIAVGNK